jgi:hypothetical protein
MRPVPNSRVILSDDEIAADMRKAGKSANAVRDVLAERAAARSEAQAEYDNDRTLSANDRYVREMGAALRDEAKRALAEAEEAE